MVTSDTSDAAEEVVEQQSSSPSTALLLSLRSLSCRPISLSEGLLVGDEVLGDVSISIPVKEASSKEESFEE